MGWLIWTVACYAAISSSLALGSGGCVSTPGTGGDSGPDDADTADHDDGGLMLPDACTEPVRAAYVGTDYITGSAGFLSLEAWDVRPDLLTLHSDLVVRCGCGFVLVIERLGGDDLTLLTPDEMSLISQISLGARANPYDAAIDRGTAFVTLFGAGKIVAVDLLAGRVADELDLSSLADADGNPEVAMVTQRGDHLFVTLQLLDRVSDIWRPTGPAKIAVLTTDPLALDGTIQLVGQNPTTDLVDGAVEGVVWVGHAGDWNVEGDGGLERVDLDGRRSLGMVMDGETLGGNVIDLVIVDATLGYATLNVPGEEDRLISFDPTAGTVLATLATSTPYSLVDVELDRASATLIVLDRDLRRGGFRLFDARTGEERRDSPLAAGLPPFDLCLLPEPPAAEE